MGGDTADYLYHHRQFFAGRARQHRLADDRHIIQFSGCFTDRHAVALYSSRGALSRTAPIATECGAHVIGCRCREIDAGAVSLYGDDDHRCFCLFGGCRSATRDRFWMDDDDGDRAGFLYGVYPCPRAHDRHP